MAVRLAAFFYGYVCTQFIGGVLANRFGGKAVLLVGVALWVVCDGLTVPASSVFPLLMLARVGMGLGEGVNFPSDHAMIAAWFVQQERSGFLAFISAGVDVGTIVSSGLSPIIASRMGWEWIYGIYCFLGLLWLTAFALLGSSKPEWHPTISAEERSFILDNRSGHAAHAPVTPPSPSRTPTSAPQTLSQRFTSLLSSGDHPVPWARLFASPSLYGIISAHFFFNYGFYVMLSWLPKYYVYRGTSLANGGFFSISMPYIAGAIGGPFSGWLSNTLLARGWRLRDVRILMNSLGSVGASSAMMVIAFYPPDDTALATAVLSLGYFFFRFSFSGYWANMVDIGHSHAGEIMGISNTVATIPGMVTATHCAYPPCPHTFQVLTFTIVHPLCAQVGNTLTGWILDATDNWGLVFFLAGCAYMLAGVTFYWLCDDVDIGEAAVNERRAKGEQAREAAEDGENGEEDDDDDEDAYEGRAINVGRATRG